jgi:hypothetical protein
MLHSLGNKILESNGAEERQVDIFGSYDFWILFSLHSNNVISPNTKICRIKK